MAPPRMDPAEGVRLSTCRHCRRVGVQFPVAFGGFRVFLTSSWFPLGVLLCWIVAYLY